MVNLSRPETFKLNMSGEIWKNQRNVRKLVRPKYRTIVTQSDGADLITS